MPNLHARTLAAIAEVALESAPYADGQQDIENIEKFARRIEQECKREECAKVCSARATDHAEWDDEDMEEARDCAAAIRRRGKP